MSLRTTSVMIGVAPKLTAGGKRIFPYDASHLRTGWLFWAWSALEQGQFLLLGRGPTADVGRSLFVI